MLLCIGIDAHPLSVEAARTHLSREQSENKLRNVHFELRPAAELDEPADSFDVITTTLVSPSTTVSASSHLCLRR